MRLSHFPPAASAAVILALAVGTPQLPLAAQQAESGPRVGESAPDFTLRGATRYGLLKDNTTLAEFRGQTVVLAFFFKARTRG